jgi:PAS domain S-box-containing protein
MIGDLIDRHHDDIVERWVETMRGRPVARALTREQLIDHLPHLLARIGAQATTGPRGTRGGVPPVPSRAHALERLSEGFQLGDLLAELAALRQVLIEVVGAAAEVLPDERAAMHAAIDDAMRTAVIEYVRVSERALRAFERLTVETAGARSLDELLERLVGVLVEASPAVDEVTILLASNGRLTARASIGLERDRSSGFSVAIGEGFAGTIAATRRELALRDAANDPLVVSDDIRRERLRALYGVPLVADGELVGVAHMGSRTAYEFSEEDLVVFRAAAARVTTLSVETTLRERERRALESAERARADAARKLRILSGILETSVDVVMVLDRHARFVLPSPHAARLFGRTPEETVGRSFCDLGLPQSDMSGLRSGIARVLSTRTPARGVADVPTTIGLRRFEYSLSPIAGEEGHAPSLVVCVARDVTDERRVEAALRQSEARFRTLVSASAMAVWLAEDYGRRHVDSPSWRELTGQTLEEYLGWGFQAAIHPDDLPRAMEAWANAVADGAMMECEYRVRAADGRFIWTHVRAVPVPEATGTRREWLGMNVDVTRLKQASEDRERMMAVLGHDLRNPLNAIMLAASLLTRAEDVPPARRATAERIVRGAARMAQMIGDLLDVTRIRAGGLPITRAPADLGEVVRQVVEELRTAHPDRTIELRASGDLRGVWDAHRLAQAASNLVGNAVVHGLASEPIVVRLEAQDGAVLLSVANATARPLPEAVVRTMFEPFGGGRRARSEGGGLGLGLPIVRAIAEAHGGTVAVSCAGTAVTLSMRLPRGEAQAGAREIENQR